MIHVITQFLGSSARRMLPGLAFNAASSLLKNSYAWLTGGQSARSASRNTLNTTASSAASGLGRAVLAEGAERIVPGGRHLTDMAFYGASGVLSDRDSDVSALRAGFVEVASTAANAAANAILPFPLGLAAGYGADQAIRRVDRTFLNQRRAHGQMAAVREMQTSNEPSMVSERVEDSDLGSFIAFR